MRVLFCKSMFVLCCALLFSACEKDNASGPRSATSAYLRAIEEYVAAARDGNFNEGRLLLGRLSALPNDMDQVDADEIAAAIEDAFRSLPLEAGNPYGDWELYHGSCEMAELVVDVVWRLTNSPDRVIDFICLQRQRYEEIAKDSERRYREVMTRQNGDAVARQELARLHNLKCNYIHSITIEDESTLMSVISNKFFSSSRHEFDASMNRLKKALGRNLGLDEQLRLLYPCGVTTNITAKAANRGI